MRARADFLARHYVRRRRKQRLQLWPPLRAVGARGCRPEDAGAEEPHGRVQGHVASGERGEC